MARRSNKRVIKKRKKRQQGVCLFCQQRKSPDYKDVEILSRFISDRGRIVPKLRTDICHKDQRKLTKALKRSRYLALLPFMVKPS